jgi:dipeptidyl aminopeptidase/acylaminoacyl peptidase
MRRPNDARSRACLFTLSALLVLAPCWAGRTVQDGVVLDGVPASGAGNSAESNASLARYRGGSEARLLDWQSDGALLVAVRAQGRDQLLRQRGGGAAGGGAAGGSGVASESVGAPGNAMNAAAAQPFHTDALAFLGDEPGHGGEALYLESLATGEAGALLPAAAHPGAPAWAHDGRQLAFSATLQEGQGTNLYVLDTTAAAAANSGAPAATPRLAAAGGDGAWQVLEWTSADRALLVRHTLSDGGDELLLADLTTGTTRRIDAPGERTPGYGHIGEARLRSDGRGVYFIGDRASDHPQLHYVDFYAGTNEVLAPDLEVGHFDVSANNRSVALSWNEFGYSRVALLDLQTRQLSTLSTLPPGSVDALRFDRAGARLAIELAPSAAPRDVYVHELASGTSARWTASQMGEFSAAQLVAPQTVRFPTWDRVASGRARTLTALLYRPRTAGPWPVLIMLGDAGLQARAQLDPFVQYCVNELKIAVVLPGLRAGDAGALDMGALLAWLGAQPDLRRERIAVQGRGSGGTLALTSLGLYGDRLRGAVDIDGPASIAQLVSLRAPVLLVRGLQRNALDAGAAEQLLWRLRGAGVESWFVAPRELGGSLSGEEGQAAAQRVIAQFLRVRLGS